MKDWKVWFKTRRSEEVSWRQDLLGAFQGWLRGRSGRERKECGDGVEPIAGTRGRRSEGAELRIVILSSRG